MYLDDISTIIFLIAAGCFSLVWNMFAVIGIVLSIKYFVDRRKGKSAESVTSSESKVEKKKEEKIEKSQKVEGKPTEKKSPEKKRMKSFDKSSVLLYTGAFLVGFSVLIFVLYNWETYSDNVKTLLILSIVLLFYTLTYLFSMWHQYKKVSDTFLLLASVSLGLAGIGIWNFYAKENIDYFRFVDFWFFYSVLLLFVYLFTYEITKKRIYFILGLVGVYLTMFFGSRALISDEKYQIAILIAGNIAFIGFMTFVQKGRHLYDKIGLPVARAVALLLNVINFFLIYNSYTAIDTIEDKLLAIVSLFLPILTIYLLSVRKKNYVIELLAEGLLILPKLILSVGILVVEADVYHALGVSIVVFIISIALSLRKELDTRNWRAFLIPVTLVSSIYMLILPTMKPVALLRADPLAMAISYFILSIGIQIRSSRTGRWWLRFLNIPLDFFAFMAFIMAIEVRLNIGLDEPYIVGMLMLIPATLYLAEWIISAGRRRRPLLIGSILFVSIGVLMAFSSPLFLFSMSAVTVAYFFLLTYLTRWKYFTIPLVLFSFLNTAAATSYFEWDSSLGIFLMILMLLFFGNLIRLKPYLGSVGKFTKQCLRMFVKLSVVMFIPIFIVTIIHVFESDQHLVVLNSLMLSLYLFSVFKDKKYLKYTSGVGIVLVFWYLLQRSDTPIFANAQLYAFPIVIYSLILSYLIYPLKPKVSKFFLTAAYLIPMSIALIQSITDPAPFSLYHGILLLVVSTALLIYGVMKQDRLLTVISIVYIVVELLIQLWDIILSIPWWVYVGFIGMSMIGVSIWIIYKVASRQEKTELTSENAPKNNFDKVKKDEKKK